MMLTLYERPVALRLLGELEILVDGQVVSEQLGRSKKLKSILEFLIINRARPVSMDEICEVLWPNQESGNPRNALKTLMHRLRTALVQGGASESMTFFINRQGMCQWNPMLDCTIDTDVFEKTCRAAETAASAQEELSLLREAFGIYRGRLLPDAAEEMWLMPQAVRLQNTYLKMVYRLLERLKESDAIDEIVEVCTAALAIDALDETCNLELLRALVACGRQQDALEAYNRVTELYYTQLGVQVSDEIRETYRCIFEAARATDLDIDHVKQVLEEPDHKQGAFVCEYVIFKDLYRIEQRCLARYGGQMFLTLITIGDENMREPENLADRMEHLRAAACNVMRRGDVLAQFSPSQFVALLPSVTHKTGEQVMRRMIMAYQTAFPQEGTVISYKLRPITLEKLE